MWRDWPWPNAAATLRGGSMADSGNAHNVGSVVASAYDGDSCLCRKAGQSTEDCPWGCDRATPEQEAEFDGLVQGHRSAHSRGHAGS